MLIKIYDKKLAYNGKELRSLFIFRRFHLQGDATVAFIDPCKVSIRDLVDQADVKANAPIFSKSMLHFIGEFFGEDLKSTVLRQRLLMACMLDCLRELSPRIPWTRAGDDLYVGKNKLSVSIATASPVSSLIHAGVNISNVGTPVPTYSLNQAQINPMQFAADVLSRFRDEMEGVRLAACKVRGVP